MTEIRGSFPFISSGGAAASARARSVARNASSFSAMLPRSVSVAHSVSAASSVSGASRRPALSAPMAISATRPAPASSRVRQLRSPDTRVSA